MYFAHPIDFLCLTNFEKNLGLWMTEVKTQFDTEIAKKHCSLAAAILLFIGKIIIPW